MSKYKRLNENERWEMIEPIINKRNSVNAISKKYGITGSVIRDWIRKYKSEGFEGLKNGKGWKPYTEELKRQAVEDVLKHGEAKKSVVRKYGISDASLLRRWIECYTSGKSLEATSSGKVGSTMITKGRKTTYEERIEMTQFCMARNKDYEATMKKYTVSYQQIYSWVRKVEKSGIDGLQDSRGKPKDLGQLSELELLKLENKGLKERNEFLEMQDAYGKKLKELEQRYGRFR